MHFDEASPLADSQQRERAHPVHRCKHVLVALSPVGDNGGLLRYAANLARVGVGVEFRFVSILPVQPDPAHTIDRDRLLAALEAEVDKAFAQASDLVKIYVNVLKGPVLDRLLEFSVEQEVDLILLGHQPQHSGRRALARRLAMKAPCSVWMVPDKAPPTLERILAPIDFSLHSADVLSVAVSLARLSGLTQCLALHVYFDAGVARYDEYDAVLRGQEQETFQKFVASIDCQGVHVEPLFVEGPHVPHAILRAAQERQIDLIVMGTRGRTRSTAILLGSETDHTLIETQTPILVVKHFGAHLGLLRALLQKEFGGSNQPRFG
jgi:nucleotide-binding universal stress UspA family protein